MNKKIINSAIKKSAKLKWVSYFVLLSALFFSCKGNNIKQTKNVASKSKVKISNQDRKYIYLTFDDGPLNGSENIDSVILAEKLKISVFLVGRQVLKNRSMETYFKYYEDNPYIDEYNHSFSHANNEYQKFYSNTASVVADIEKNQDTLKLPFKIVRLPGRNMWRLDGRKKNDEISGAAAADTIALLGYKVIGWDIEWRHDDKTGAPLQSAVQIKNKIDTLLNEGKTFTPGNIVVLLHDQMFKEKWEESELKTLIDSLRANSNYVFEQIRFYPDK